MESTRRGHRVIRLLAILLSGVMTSSTVLAANAGWLELGNTIELDDLSSFEMAFSSDGNRVAIAGASAEGDNNLKVFNYYDPAIYSFNPDNNPDWEPLADADGDGLNNIFEWTNSVFTLVTDRHSWTDARADAISRGGHLATVAHFSDWEIVKATAYAASGVPQVYNTPEENAVWLGASDSDLEDRWSWVINEPLSFTAWAINTPDGATTENYLQIGHTNQYKPWNDADDWWELTYVLEQNDSNWLIADTDGDGLSDGYEKTNSLTRADLQDSDEDAVSDPDEINVYGTDPNIADTDGDGLSDGEEINDYKTNPLVDGDADNDGLSDYLEASTYLTSPTNKDTDGDGISDFYEVTGSGEYFIINNVTWSDANSYASSLGAELATIKTEAQFTAVTNFLSTINAPPDNSYVWIGGLFNSSDWYWSDQTLMVSNYDVVSNFLDVSTVPTDANVYSTIKASDFTDTNDPLYIMKYDTEQPRSALLYKPSVATDPNNSDSDEDGLSDYAEIHGYGTDPNNPDTDGDNFNDGQEIAVNTISDTTYEVVSGNFTWSQAKWDAHYRGGHLATITSSEEQNAIAAKNPGDKFIGGTDITDEGVWKWITGESFNTNALQWALGQPDNSGDGQHFLRITDDSPPYSYLIDDCDNVETFVTGYILEIPNQNPLIDDIEMYQLTMNVNGDGVVTPSSGVVISNATVNISATPNNGSLFTGWTGDLVADYQSASSSIVVLSNMTLTAEFSQDADNDTLSNDIEITLGTNPRMADTDGDGLDDNIEVAMTNMVFNFDPSLHSGSEMNRFQDALETIPGMMDNMIMEYRSADIDITSHDNIISIQLPIEASTNSGLSWFSTTNVIEIIRPATNDMEFFELEFD